MNELKSLKEANEISTVRLVSKRQRAKVGDIFRLSPCKGIFLWGRLIKRAKFFGVGSDFNLVYIYDAISETRPSLDVLSPRKLIIGPSVVNNLGWTRGYWEIVASCPITPAEMLEHHFFIRYRGTGSRSDYDIVDEQGQIVRGAKVQIEKLAQSGFGNFNLIDWQIRTILRERGLID
jgi:hypothetical protein